MERQFPKNVRQIGNVSDQPKIYMEDYVNTYLNQLKEQAADRAVSALLLGEIVRQGKQDVVYISGALQMKEIEINGTEIIISDEIWTELEDQKKEYFQEKEVVGWCLVESGHPMGLNRGVTKIHERIFSRENTVFLWRDAREEDEIFYVYKYNELMQMGGHYIYYEKNPDMQNYMISMRKMIGVTPSEMVEDRAAKNFRDAIRGKLEYQERRENSHFLYVMSVFLVVVVLAIGISTMNNFDKMEAVQQSVEALSLAVSTPENQDSIQGEGLREQQSLEDGKDKEEELQSEIEVDKSLQEIEETEETEEEFTGTMPEVSTIQEQLKEESYYIVEKGDTLDSISKKQYGTTGRVDAICRMNGLEDGNLIFIGQKLLLP